MLKQITIENFRSILEPVTFSMEAYTSKVSEHEDHIAHIGDQSLLRVSSFYGPNGGGKSNVLLALQYLRYITTTEYPMQSSSTGDRFSCHKLSKDKETTINAYFVDEHGEYGYGVSVSLVEEGPLVGLNSLSSPKKVKTVIFDEWMTYRAVGEKESIVAYHRDEDGKITGDNSLIDLLPTEISVSKNKTILNYVASNYANKQSEGKNVLLDALFALFSQISSISGLSVETGLYFFPKESMNGLLKVKPYFLKFLNCCGLAIEEIEFMDIGNALEVVFVHKSDSGKIFNVPLIEESTGTKKIWNLAFDLTIGLKFPKILLADDFDAAIHPQLLKNIIEYVSTGGGNYFQLIFNSHDLTNMNNEVFRRDEIWFAYKDEEASTRIVPLSNIVNYKGEQVRKDASYNKQYLEGRYGADPFIQCGRSWKIDGE